MSQTTNVTWAVCFCTDSQHTEFDRYAFTGDRAEAVRQVSGYDTTAHVIERQTVESTRTVLVGAASPLNTAASSQAGLASFAGVTR